MAGVRPLERVAALVTLLAATALGLSAGAMLTEAVVLVGYWRSLPPPEFLSWFGANEPRLVLFYGPLQIVSTVLAVVAALLAVLAGRGGSALIVVAAVLAIAVLGLYPLYFRAVNARFVAAGIEAGAVPAALAQWALWQWARTGIGGAAFVLALLATRR